MKKISDSNLVEEKKIAQAKSEYKFQEKLTTKLDTIVGDFSEMTLLEIVLWKMNRYPELTTEIIDEINLLRKSYSLAHSKVLLRKLLALKGFDLPMASTVLRFASPEYHQIIDQRVYRFITPEHDELKIPYNKDEKVNFYFIYLENLRKVCKDYNIPFKESDRIIYQLDKIHNSEIPIKY